MPLVIDACNSFVIHMKSHTAPVFSDLRTDATAGAILSAGTGTEQPFILDSSRMGPVKRSCVGDSTVPLASPFISTKALLPNIFLGWQSRP